MKNKKHKQEKITKLKIEIKIKDFILKELITILTYNKIKIPKILLKNIQLLYGEEKNEI